MPQRPMTRLLSGMAAVVLAAVFYLCWAKPWLWQVIQTPEHPLWDLMTHFYPRLAAERWRLPPDFFVQKADQVLLRAGILVLLLSAAWQAWANMRWRRRWWRFWQMEMPTNAARILLILLYAVILGFALDWRTYLHDYQAWAAFYQPLALLAVFGDYPGDLLIDAVWAAFLANCLWGMSGRYPLAASLCMAGLWLLVQGWLLGFGKMDHGTATLTTVILCAPALAAEIHDASSLVHAWGLRLMQVGVIAAYLFGGLEKLLISQGAWVLSGEVLAAYLRMEAAPAGLWVARQPWLCHLLAVATVGGQLSFLLLLTQSRWRWLPLAFGVGFHAGTVLLLHIGAFLNPWTIVYGIWLPWPAITRRLERWLQV